MSHKERPAFDSEQDNRFSTVLQQSLLRQGLTLEVVARRLEEAGTPVSQATLSYWQRGRALPTRESSLAAITELERVLRLPIGHLTSSLPGDAFTRWKHLDHMSLSDRVQSLFESLEINPRGDVDSEYMHDHVTLLEDDITRVETSREVIRARRDDVQRTVAIFATTGPDEALPLVEAGTGCELGRVVDLGERGLIAVELLLSQPLAEGQPHLRSMTIQWVSNMARDEGDVQRILPSSVPFLVFDATFRGSIPLATSYETTPHDYVEDLRSRRPLVQVLPGGRHAQVCLADPPPGWHSLVWSFDEPAPGSEP